jgi:formate dehydrogenase major subunit
LRAILIVPSAGATYVPKGPTPTNSPLIRIALDQIAQRVKATRDADFTTRDEQGRLLNSVRSIGTLGGATIDNEENYLIKKLFGGGLGVVSIENQARI